MNLLGEDFLVRNSLKQLGVSRQRIFLFTGRTLEGAEEEKKQVCKPLLPLYLSITCLPFIC